MRAPWRGVLAVLLVLALSFAGAAVYAGWQAGPRLHAHIIQVISTSLESEVELGNTTITWFPPRLRAEQLTVRHHGRRDVPPLIVLSSFTAKLSFTNLWNKTIDHVVVDGLEINIPPRQGAEPRIPHPKGDGKPGGSGLYIRQITAQNARIAVIPRNEHKNARVWDVHSLVMHDIRPDRPATFEAALINPIPYGLIEAKGDFGPWDSDEPSETPLGGAYVFAADLGTIKGLGGHLDAKGVMKGVLDHIETEGQTSTDEFRLTSLDGQSLPLKTTYRAVVDGTKGDVELREVEVTLGRSRLHARGTIEGTKGVKGKRVVLNVQSQALDLSDTLRLVMKPDRPLARGSLIVDAAFDLPQGDADVLDRLELDGSVRAEHLRFTDDAIQEKVDTLSRKGQGHPEDLTIDAMASTAHSKFTLSKSRFTFKDLTLEVEGATVGLNGTYELGPKRLDLAGTLKLKASASQTMTGYKTWLLKPFDPLFRKQGAGTLLAIKIQGTSDHPEVGIDIKKSLQSK
ncbi:MAG: hypothetical protein ABI665_02990 [Vicinamibacterales bacterium]